MKSVTFYTKLNCHLCDEAYQLLLDVALDMPLQIDILDITHAHNNIEAEYGERIPVIAASDRDTELEWPFTFDQVKAYLGGQ